MVKAMTTHSECMTRLYRELHNLTNAEVDDLSKYEALFEQASSYQTWFKTRKRVANTMKAAASKTA